jgi:High potential iron-sulfur protein
MTMTTNRRTFMMNVAACGTAVMAGMQTAHAAEPANKLDEASATATGLGYKHDTTKADTKKYPQHNVADKCSTCQLFQGKAGDAWGACPLFAGKSVAANGWCSAWVKKTA